jgi:hypothetical protein
MTRRLFFLLAVPLLVTGCGGSEPLTADSTCTEYLDREPTERHNAAMKISAELNMQSGGNPMYGMTFDSGCSNNTEFTLREVFAP